MNDAQPRYLLARVCWWRDNSQLIPWLPHSGDGSRYDSMKNIIDPSTLKTADIVRLESSRKQKEGIAPYHPSINQKLAVLFKQAIT